MWCLFQPLSSVIPWLQFGHFPSCLSHNSFTSPNRVLLVLRFRSSSSFFRSVGINGFKALGVFMCLVILVSEALTSCLPLLANTQFLSFFRIQYLDRIQLPNLFGCRRLHHDHRVFHISSSILLKAILATVPLW